MVVMRKAVNRGWAGWVEFWKVKELLQNTTLEATCALVIVWIFCSPHRTPYGRYLKVVEYGKRRE